MTRSAATEDTEVCRIARELIRIDTSNAGDGRAVGEHRAAAYVADLLTEVGLDVRVVEPAPRRTSVVARWPGSDPTLPALMLHGHLDVVPAEAGEWTVDPFEGVVADGTLWGRGAVDMKDMVAVIVAVVRDLRRRGHRPRRDLVLAFFADEEDGSRWGSKWIVDHHPELFRGVDVAVGEVGGWSIDVRGRRAYLMQTGEKGTLWLRLRARGRAGHAAQLHPDSAVAALVAALHRISTEPWPVCLTPTTEALVAGVRDLAALPEGLDARAVTAELGTSRAFVEPALQTVATVTVVDAGSRINVVPGEATARVDVRFLPGQRDQVLDRLGELAGPSVSLEVELDVPAVETELGGRVLDVARRSLRSADPGAEILPYFVPAGTDNAFLAELGVRGFGFVPLRLPTGFDFPGMFHGVDERVPLDALLFAQRVLGRFVRRY